MARKVSSRELTLLGVLAVVVVLVLYWQQDSRGVGGGAGGGIDDGTKIEDAPEVRMDLLARHGGRYDPKGRNLFQYYTPPRVAAAETRPQPVIQRPEAPKRPTQPAPARPTPQPTVRKPPPIPYRYLGFLGPKDSKIAVFESGQEITLARAGEVIGEKFRVVEFGHESIIMGYTDEPWTQETTELGQSR